LPKSHVDDSTKPHAAAASTLMRPTMAWSMKNINTLVSCANIEGMLNWKIKLSIWPLVMGLFSLINANNWSLLYDDDAITPIYGNETLLC
jgi:hypothetical protein